MTLADFIYLLNVLFWGMAAGVYVVAFWGTLSKVDAWTTARVLSHGAMIVYLVYGYAETFVGDVQLEPRHYVGLALAVVLFIVNTGSLVQKILGKPLTLSRHLTKNGE